MPKQATNNNTPLETRAAAVLFCKLTLISPIGARLSTDHTRSVFPMVFHKANGTTNSIPLSEGMSLDEKHVEHEKAAAIVCFIGCEWDVEVRRAWDSERSDV